jgi:hypothetical protein
MMSGAPTPSRTFIKIDPCTKYWSSIKILYQELASEAAKASIRITANALSVNFIRTDLKVYILILEVPSP